MSYILVENLTKTLLDRTLLDSVGFAVNQGEKIALVAKNGSGKSTLLRILAGKETYDSGKISKQNGIRWGFLEQDPELDLEKTISEEIFSSNSPMISAVRLYEESLMNPDDQDKMQLAHEAMNNHNAWEYEAKVHKVLKKLKLTNSADKKISTLSGGQRKRVALAKILIDSPDFLILDEPTNHLDLEMIDWLENYFVEQQITLLLVTHDRYFLDRVCNQILELDKGTIYKHKGNYSYYLEKKENRESVENRNIEKTNLFLKKELEWVRRGPSGRLSKNSGRVDAYHKLKSSVKAKNTNEKVSLDVTGKRQGGKILEIHNLCKAFGDKKILDMFNYSFTRGEKVGIIGNNGVGKTTFLNLIMENEQPDSGKITKGETITFGYYSQDQTELNQNEKVIDSAKSISTHIKLSDGTEVSASKMLERFLFPPALQQNMVSKLSGGEKKRLSLLRILMKNPNFLILDEPTNDFDLMTLDVLEEFLLSFKGCLIVISHDRYFMDRIVDHLFVFKGDAVIQDFPGNYSDYRDSVSFEKSFSTKLEAIPEKVEDKKARNREANLLYKEIGKLENKKKKLTNSVTAMDMDYEEMGKIAKQISEIEEEIEKLNEKWLELSI
jgi:ATP-binding cassette subfamily F protein uup